MSFATEWALAIHRAVWFPVLWLTGLEAQAIEAPFPESAPASRAASAASCPARRSSRSTGQRSHMRSTTAARKARGGPAATRSRVLPSK